MIFYYNDMLRHELIYYDASKIRRVGTPPAKALLRKRVANR